MAVGVMVFQNGKYLITGSKIDCEMYQSRKDKNPKRKTRSKSFLMAFIGVKDAMCPAPGNTQKSIDFTYVMLSCTIPMATKICFYKKEKQITLFLEDTDCTYSIPQEMEKYIEEL